MFWKLLFWCGVAAVCAGSLLPRQALPRAGVSFELLHAAAYFVLMALSYPAFRARRERRIAAGLIALGLALELLQTLTPQRVMSLADVAANAAGAVLAVVGARTAAAIRAARRRRRSSGG